MQKVMLMVMVMLMLMILSCRVSFTVVGINMNSLYIKYLVGDEVLPHMFHITVNSEVII